jgi:hypothetical protein
LALLHTFSDSLGHDIFAFSTLLQAGAHIASFDLWTDILHVAQLLKADGYTDTNLVADHVITFAPAGANSTAVMLDPTGHDPSHAGTMVTLEHILPQAASMTAIPH